jgi:hypothetical protein
MLGEGGTYGLNWGRQWSTTGVVMPRQLQIMKQLQQLFMTITTANGYNNDVGENVFFGRGLFGDDTPRPFLSVVENDRPPETIFAGEFKQGGEFDWILLVQGWAIDDPVNPSVPAYYLAADVAKACSRIIAVDTMGNGIAPWFMLGGLISDMKFSPGIVRPPVDTTTDYCMFYLPLVLKFAYNIFTP